MRKETDVVVSTVLTRYLKRHPESLLSLVGDTSCTFAWAGAALRARGGGGPQAGTRGGGEVHRPAGATGRRCCRRPAEEGRDATGGVHPHAGRAHAVAGGFGGPGRAPVHPGDVTRGPQRDERLPGVLPQRAQGAGLVRAGGAVADTDAGGRWSARGGGEPVRAAGALRCAAGGRPAGALGARVGGDFESTANLGPCASCSTIATPRCARASPAWCWRCVVGGTVVPCHGAPGLPECSSGEAACA